MTPLRQRMLDSMLQYGFSQRTQGCYVEAISRMAPHYRGDPAQLTPEEFSKYLLYMVKERHLSFSTVNQAASASFTSTIGWSMPRRHWAARHRCWST